MIHWLIPYLVAYNASIGSDWKYGPEYVFKAETHTIMMTDNLSEMHSEIDMNITCRPMTSNLIQCCVESATVENWANEPDGTKNESDSHPPEEFQMGNVIFQVEFNEEGISKLWFLNTNGSYRLNMVRAILGTVNLGINLDGKKDDRYTSMEKSIIGICETTFDISRIMSLQEEKLETAIDGYTFDVPGFKEKLADQPIVIGKYRHLNECSKKTPYFFGSYQDTKWDKKHGLESEMHITFSVSRIYLGKKSFSAYTRNTGTLQFTSSRAQSMNTLMKTDDSIRLSLQAIRPAKEELRNTGNLAKAGAGSAPGIPWPEHDEP